MLAPNPIFDRADEISELFAPACVDIFAGCGGWSIGTEQAFVEAGWRDRRVDLMVNHWTTAVAVHTVNHPLTHHLRADVREVDPADVLPGRRIAYLHASPDCTDHSKAKGGKPRRKEIRALADVVIVWAAKRRPDVITLENVEEFRQWGPLLDCGTPDPSRRGHEFERWKGELEALGYEVEARELRACDYGAPTTRKRLFVIARCDGRPIVWPEATHGQAIRTVVSRSDQLGAHHGTESARAELPSSPSGWSLSQSDEGRRRRTRRVAQTVYGQRYSFSNRYAQRVTQAHLNPYLTAADCIDWSIPMLSIFATPDEAKAFAKQHGVGVPRRPLKPKTLARIAGGLDKFVLKAARPFIVNIENYGWNSGGVRAAGEPLSTVTAGPKGGKHAAVDVTLAPYSIPRYGERPGQDPRCQTLEQPAATITGTGNGTNLVTAVLSRFNGQKGKESRCHSPAGPVTTLDTQNRIGLVAALVTKHYSGVTGSAADAPLDTITATDHNAITCAHLMKFRGDSLGTAADEPMPTVTSGAGAARDAGAAHALGVSVAYLSHFYTSNSRGGEGDPLKPAKTITSGGQHAAVTVALATPLNHGESDEPERCESRVEVDRADGICGGGVSEAGGPRPEQHERAAGRSASVDRALQAGGTAGSDGERHHAGVPAAGSVAAPYLIGAGGAAYAAKPKSAGEPANTVMVNDRRAIVAAFLAAYYGEGSGLVGHSPAEPLPTATGTARFGLVTVVIDGTTYVVTDIAMRMLTPRELANAQGFPADYVIDRTADGKPVSKADQVKLIGNAVPPAFARAIVKANVVDQGVLGTPPRPKRRRTREAVLA